MYQLTDTSNVIRLRDGATIPSDPRNQARQEFDAWVAAGNAPIPATSQEVLAPQTVTRFQARAALMLAGLLEMVEAAIANADPLTKLAWADAQSFERDSPMITNMAAAFGFSDAQLDSLFTQASLIK